MRAAVLGLGRWRLAAAVVVSGCIRLPTFPHGSTVSRGAFASGACYAANVGVCLCRD